MMGDTECPATASSEWRCRRIERPLLDGTEITKLDRSVGLHGGLPVLFER